LWVVYDRDISNNYVSKDELRWVEEAKVNGFSLERFQGESINRTALPQRVTPTHKYILPDRESRLQLVDMMRLIIGEFYSHQSNAARRLVSNITYTAEKNCLRAKTEHSGTALDQSERVHKGLRTVDFGRRVDKEMLMGCVDS
jgi:hypothetical protein